MRYKSLFRLKCLCLGLSVCVCVCSCVFCVCLSDCVRACVSELGQTSGNGNVCMRNTANDRARQAWGVEGVRERETHRERERDVRYAVPMMDEAIYSRGKRCPVLLLRRHFLKNMRLQSFLTL